MQLNAGAPRARAGRHPLDVGWLALEEPPLCYDASDTVVAWLECERVGNLVGRGWTIYVHPESQAAIVAAINRIQGTLRGTRAAIQLRGATGIPIRVAAQFLIWHDARGVFPHGIMIQMERLATGASNAEPRQLRESHGNH
jgi:hypothetical protein